MSKLEYKDGYWDQALNILQVEENWMDAQVVLKRAERKQVFIRFSSIAVLFLLVLGISYLTFIDQHSYASRLKMSISQIKLDPIKNRMPQTNVTKDISYDSNKKFNASSHLKDDNTFARVDVTSSEINKSSKTNRVLNKIKTGDDTKTNATLPSKLSENTLPNKKSEKNSINDIGLIQYNDNLQLTKRKIYEKSEIFPANENAAAVQKVLIDKEKNMPMHLTIDSYAMERNDLSLIGHRNLFSKPLSQKAVLIENYHSISSKVRPRLNSLSFVVGTSRITGFGSDNRNRINPEIGLEYERKVKKNMFFITGLSYFSIDGLNHSTSFSDVEIGFDKFEKRVNFSSKKVHYLFTPFLLKWEFNKYHSVTFGGGISYFLTNNSIAETSTFENEILQTNNSEETKGYAQGYRKFNSSLLGGYEFRVNTRTTLGIQYQYGLNTIVNDEIYTPNNKDTNARLRILLKRKIR